MVLTYDPTEAAKAPKPRALVCCWCGARARAGVLVPGWGYLLRPCLHVAQVRAA